jgi:GDPmannose 4,6-dehydratase/GDP-4-dehydro-6-deoxy-D-mannose reductase
MKSNPVEGIDSIAITGINGSGGSYLAEYFVQNHPAIKVHGFSRWHSTSHSNLGAIETSVCLHEVDLNDFSSILNGLEASKPKAVFHLASHANVRASFTTPLAVLQNNIMATGNLLEAIRHYNPKILVHLCSTSEVYGQVDPRNVPISENCPFNPASPYAVSKCTQDLLGLSYFKSYGMNIVRTRMFTYLNPRRSDLFATSFALQVARIEMGLQEKLLHGNLDSVRTILDVRDAMESYWYALVYCSPGEAYNIGGNTTITVGQFLETLKKLSRKAIPSEVDPKLLRPSDVTLQIPNIDKFVKETGWQPRYSVESSIQHLLDFCRSVVSREAS